MFGVWLVDVFFVRGVLLSDSATAHHRSEVFFSNGPITNNNQNYFISHK